MAVERAASRSVNGGDIEAGTRLATRLVAARVLWNMKVAAPIYGGVPPAGALAGPALAELLAESEAAGALQEASARIRAQLDLLRARFIDADTPHADSVKILDSLRRTKAAELSVFGQSVASRLEDFRATYNADNYATQLWHPGQAGDYPILQAAYKNHVLSAVRQNPLLKKQLEALEAPDVELCKLHLKRYTQGSPRAAKSTTGLRGQPRAVRKLSKNRELKTEPISALVHFMPRLCDFASESAQ